MGSSMRPTIFNERVAAAVKNWHNNARNHVKNNINRDSNSNTPFSSMPETPTQGMSPIHLLHNHHSCHSDSPFASPRPRPSTYENQHSDIVEGSFDSSSNHHQHTLQMQLFQPRATELPTSKVLQHEFRSVSFSEFSFRNSPSNNSKS